VIRHCDGSGTIHLTDCLCPLRILPALHTLPMSSTSPVRSAG
jgi:hypothetical protein